MKKVLFAITVVFGLSLALVATSCGGGGGGGSDDEEVASASDGNGISGSEVFIPGRSIDIYLRWACDHEVTQGEYETYCSYSSSSRGLSPRVSWGLGSNYPVYHVNWYEAIVYCNKRSLGEHLTPCYSIGGKTNPSTWGAVPTSSNENWVVICNFSANGYRLPTEAEWEYLARGGNTSNSGQTTYSESNTVGNVAWYEENARALGEGNPGYGSHAVKTKVANNRGLYDMSGNVWEWCWDYHGIITPSTSSTGSVSGYDRVIRGGSWVNISSCCSVAHRSPAHPYSYEINGPIGFRVVRSAE